MLLRAIPLVAGRYVVGRLVLVERDEPAVLRLAVEPFPAATEICAALRSAKATTRVETWRMVVPLASRKRQHGGVEGRLLGLSDC